MPFDITENTNIVPERLDFEVEFEPTKFEGKKYVINAKTGEYVGIVGKGFNCVSHTSFFNKVLDHRKCLAKNPCESLRGLSGQGLFSGDYWFFIGGSRDRLHDTALVARRISQFLSGQFR